VEGFEQLNRFILFTSAVRPQCFLPSDLGARAVYSTGHRVNVTRFSCIYPVEMPLYFEP